MNRIGKNGARKPQIRVIEKFQWRQAPVAVSNNTTIALDILQSQSLATVSKFYFQRHSI